MDAQVSYRAESVRSKFLPLRHLALKAALDHGLLTVDPIAFGLPHGELTGKVRLDARGAVPVTPALDMAVTHVQAQDFLPKVQGGPRRRGRDRGRALLTGRGNSVHKAAAAANGRIAVALPEGHMRKAFAELMGVNIIPGLPELWSKDPAQTDLRCAVADFDVKGWRPHPAPDRGGHGGGHAHRQGFGQSRGRDAGFHLAGQEQQAPRHHLIAPFHLRGSFARPTFKVDVGAVVAQAGIGAALAAFASPLAVILPFLNPGGSHHMDCSAVLAQARAAGAPVKAAAIAAAPSATRK